MPQNRRPDIPAETIRAAGERYINGAKIADLSRALGIPAGTLYDRLHAAGYRLSPQEIRRRQGQAHAAANGYRGDLAMRTRARDAEAIWAALDIKFEDAPRIKDQPGRLSKIMTHVPKACSLERA